MTSIENFGIVGSSLEAGAKSPARRFVLDEKHENHSENTNADSKSCSRPEVDDKSIRGPNAKPTKMQRAKVWSVEVENAFRYQSAGYRDREEYLNHYPSPEHWSLDGFVKCLRSKKDGYFMYFRKARECEDKYLNRIIIYEY